MSDGNIIDRAKEKKLAAEEKLAQHRAAAAMLQKEVEQWDTFLVQWERLNREKATKGKAGKKLPDNQSGKIILKKGSLPAVVAEILIQSENHTRRAALIAEEMKKRGAITSDHYVNITYTTLTRRDDLFEKTAPGTFKLKTTEFEVAE